MNTETIDHPRYYNQHPSGIECIDLVEELPFNLGNAIKYLWRAGLKCDELTDLKKAHWYLGREANRLAKIGDRSGYAFPQGFVRAAERVCIGDGDVRSVLRDVLETLYFAFAITAAKVNDAAAVVERAILERETTP